MRRWMAAIMVLCLLALPLAAAEGLVLNTAEELTEYLNRCRAEGLAEMETICSGDLYAQISADDFAGLYRMAYLAGVSDFRLRYSDSGTLQFQNVVYQAVPAAAECATEEEVRAAAKIPCLIVRGNNDYSTRLPFLPMYPVTLNYWQADEEFPASGRLLLDSSAEHYLTVEDSVTVGELILQALTGSKL